MSVLKFPHNIENIPIIDSRLLLDANVWIDKMLPAIFVGALEASLYELILPEVIYNQWIVGYEHRRVEGLKTSRFELWESIKGKSIFISEEDANATQVEFNFSDEGDIPIAKAAVASQTDIIVTSNFKDFDPKEMWELGIAVLTPGDVIIHFLRHRPFLWRVFFGLASGSNIMSRSQNMRQYWNGKGNPSATKSPRLAGLLTDLGEKYFLPELCESILDQSIDDLFSGESKIILSQGYNSNNVTVVKLPMHKEEIEIARYFLYAISSDNYCPPMLDPSIVSISGNQDDDTDFSFEEHLNFPATSGDIGHRDMLADQVNNSLLYPADSHLTEVLLSSVMDDPNSFFLSRKDLANITKSSRPLSEIENELGIKPKQGSWMMHQTVWLEVLQQGIHPILRVVHPDKSHIFFSDAMPRADDADAEIFAVYTDFKRFHVSCSDIILESRASDGTINVEFYFACKGDFS